LAYNYRSRRAVMDSVGGITGMEMYEAPQKYLDASVSYKINKYAEVFVDGTNLTNEYQKYYLVWPDQPAHSNFSERMFMVGVRGQGATAAARAQRVASNPQRPDRHARFQRTAARPQRRLPPIDRPVLGHRD